MGRMNIYLDKKEDLILNNLKEKFNVKSKEDVIKKLINDNINNQNGK